MSAGRSLAGLLCLLQLAACGQPLHDAVSKSRCTLCWMVEWKTLPVRLPRRPIR